MELFLVGAAVVLDTALLMIVLERINRPFVALWLKLLVIGTVAFHLGYFGRAMISKIEPTDAVLLDHLFMCLLVSGLFLLPSGMLHAAARIFHTGLDAKPVRDLRYGALYLPKAIVFESRMPGEDTMSKPQDASHKADWIVISRCSQSQGRLERGMALPRMTGVSDTHIDVAGALVAMEQHGILLAFPLAFQSIHGAVLLGDRLRNDRLADEQMISIAFLCDQLAATLGNKKESMRRFQVERRMIHSEKLSTLGLIAGSLAHELRNPLSSIRTIASLTMEELGPEHANRQDLSIIVSEIDKLSKTTTRLLDSARPSDESGNSIKPDLVIGKLLVLLTPLARQLHVDLRHSLNCPNVEVAGSEAAMSEVFFNLIKNGIEAATGRSDAWVQIQSEAGHGSTVEIVVSDNGPGIASELLDTLFEPFVTGKSDGTGLGLFVVADRIREMNGSINCSRCDENLTQFRVTFPGTTFNEQLLNDQH